MTQDAFELNDVNYSEKYTQLYDKFGSDVWDILSPISIVWIV